MTRVLANSLEGLLADCRAQLFESYLPFWEQGGYDIEHGGFSHCLRDDGSAAHYQKDIWYQGRGIWVYSLLYNEFDRNPKWLEWAGKTRNFMVEHMHRGDGTWLGKVNRRGNPVDGSTGGQSENIYGALFAAAGLIQYAKVTGSAEDLQLAKRSLRKAVERYEDPDYRGVVVPGVDSAGLRAQGHSFMMVWVIPQLLEVEADPWLEAVVREHLDVLATRFWNPDYGISNEFLFHDYSRVPSQASRMVPGHSIEAQWMGMEEAIRQGNMPLSQIFKNRMRRIIEMSWDYPFGGTCDTGYNVFTSEEGPAGPVLDIKNMWAQTEVAIGCLLAYEHTGDVWAREWFEHSWEFLQRTMTTEHGHWRLAVDRLGREKRREGISVHRKENFHQPRCLMYLIRALTRIIARKDKPAIRSQ